MNNLLVTFLDVLSTVGAVLLAIVILLIMITIHELGHYLVGKALKFKITEFSIGMGPAIFKRKNKETGEQFSIRAIPLGGFCSFYGEDEEIKNKKEMTEEEKKDVEGAFNNKEPWKRILVLVAGATMNFLLGIIFLMLSIGFYGQQLIRVYEVNPVEENISAIQPDDILLSINGKNIYMTTDVVTYLENKKAGDEVKVVVLRDGERVNLTTTLTSDPNGESLIDLVNAYSALGMGTVIEVSDASRNYFEAGDSIISINDNQERELCTRLFTASDVVKYLRSLNEGDEFSIYVVRDGTYENLKFVLDFDSSFFDDDSELLQRIGILGVETYLSGESIPVKFGFFETIGRGFAYSFSVAGTVFKILGQLLTGKIGLRAMGGTITTISATTTMIKTGGFQYFFELGGYIGINLAVVNLLPIPALDGSRVVFCIIEWIRKKPVNRKIEGIIHTVGLVLLLIFSVLVDVLHLF